jgi:hypothetical protein
MKNFSELKDINLKVDICEYIGRFYLYKAIKKEGLKDFKDLPNYTVYADVLAEYKDVKHLIEVKVRNLSYRPNLEITVKKAKIVGLFENANKMTKQYGINHKPLFVNFIDGFVCIYNFNEIDLNTIKVQKDITPVSNVNKSLGYKEYEMMYLPIKLATVIKFNKDLYNKELKEEIFKRFDVIYDK